MYYNILGLFAGARILVTRTSFIIFQPFSAQTTGKTLITLGLGVAMAKRA